MSERFGTHVRSAHLLNSIIPYCSDSIQTRIDIGRVDKISPFRGMAPDTGKAIRLQLQTDGKRVRLQGVGQAQLLHFRFDEIRNAFRPDAALVLIDFKQIENVSSDFVLKMMKAGEGTFIDEFRNAGFDLVDRLICSRTSTCWRFRLRPAKCLASP